MPFAAPDNWRSTPVDNETILRVVCLQLGFIEAMVSYYTIESEINYPPECPRILGGTHEWNGEGGN